MLKLERSYLDNCTLGKVYFKGEFECCTVERPWVSNKPFKSCTPPGIYELHEHKSPKHGQCYALKNHDLGVGINKGDSVRWGCLIHVANWPKQVEGCIGPGKKLHSKKWGVASSRDATADLFRLIRINKITHIEIK